MWGIRWVGLCCLPAVNLVDHPCSTRSTMEILKVFAHPLNEVIFIDTLDQLVQ